jgi:hypothetical protein
LRVWRGSFCKHKQQQISSSLAHYTGFRIYGTKSVLLGYISLSHDNKSQAI